MIRFVDAPPPKQPKAAAPLRAPDEKIAQAANDPFAKATSAKRGRPRKAAKAS